MDERPALPHNLDAESGIVGDALVSPDALPELAEMLPDPAAFYADDLRTVWGAVLGLWRDGRPVDALTVAERLRDEGVLGKAGGQEAILDLVTRSGLKLGNHVYHAGIVREHAAMRSVIEHHYAGLADAWSRNYTAAEVATLSAERLRGAADLDATAGDIRAGDLMDDFLARVRRREGGESTGMPTPFWELNKMTDGFQPEDFVLLAGRPSMGKTACALNIADHCSVQWGEPSLFVSLEMGNPQLAERLAIARARVDGGRVRVGDLSQDDWSRLDAAAATIKAAPIYLVRRPGRNLLSVVTEVRRAHRRRGIKLVTIDYVQLIHSDNPRDNEVASLTKISGALKNLAKELGIPIIALSQLNRGLESRDEKRPKMTDLRGSGALEQDADLILFLHRPEYFDANEMPGLAELIVAKNRNGRTGAVTLRFTPHLMKFEDHFDSACPPAVLDPLAF